MTTATARRAAAVNAALVKAFRHPLRGRLLTRLDEVEASPKELADLFAADLKQVAYHVSKLAEWGLIELVDTDTRRGGTQHYYRAIARPILFAEGWDELPRLVREVQAIGDLRTILSEILDAYDARTLDARTNRTMARERLLVDEEGFDEMEVVAEAALEGFKEVQARSAARLAKARAVGIPARAVVMTFEYPEPPTKK